ncbi:MAG: hypothetical protein ACPLRX_06895 [Candidatus Saccharicenans sp.]
MPKKEEGEKICLRPGRLGELWEKKVQGKEDNGLFLSKRIGKAFSKPD